MEPGQRQAVRKASLFYGQPQSLREVRCVVKGTISSWHHLDEARTRWWDYRNIIPLDQALNDQLDKRRHRPLPRELQPGSLEDKGVEHWRQAHFAQAYGCARLSAFLAVPPRGDTSLGSLPDPNRAIDSCASALLYVRPISAISFAIDTLKRNIIPILCSFSISNLAAARLSLEIGSYFRDYGLFRDALAWAERTQRYLKDVDDGSRATALKERAAQHRGLAKVGLNPSLIASPENPLAIGGSVYVEADSNEFLFTARSILRTRRRDRDEAMNLVKKVYKLKEKKQTSSWAYAEALWTDAESHLTRDRMREAFEIGELGRDLFQSVGIVPTALLSPKCVNAFHQRYPNDLYIAPRNPAALGEFLTLAMRVLQLLTERTAPDSGTHA